MTAHRWVIGRGLLGSAITRTRETEPFRADIPWHEPDAAARALRDALGTFLSETDGPADIYWCAGRGVTSTPVHELDAEVAVFASFLGALEKMPAEQRERVGVFLASSVGGAYAGSVNPPFTESTPAIPLSAYGTAKLQMESLLYEATGRGRWRALVGRITNLYGPGQTPGKGQGLISAVVRSFVTEQPVSIFVPLDTLRDYIYEDDCAEMIAAGMQRLRGEEAGTTVTKIISGTNAVSISAILAEHTRLRRRRSPIILGGTGGAGQARDLRVRSEVWPDLSRYARTTLSEGLDAVFRNQLAAWSIRQ